MLHANPKYNGRVVDLREPAIVATLLAAEMGLMQAIEISDGSQSTSGIRQAADGLNELRRRGEELEPIPDDEPVFLLRAQDLTASLCVDYWAVRNESLPNGDKVLIEMARDFAKKMAEWPVKKVADA